MKEKTEEKARKKVVVEEVGEAPREAKKEEVEIVTKTDENTKVESVPKLPEVSASESAPLQSKPKFNFLWILLPGLLLLAALVGGVYVYEQGVARERAKLAQTTPEPTFEASVSPTPTSTPEKIDLSKYTIAIQNGSGIPGEATKAQNLLTKAGFKVTSVGNAQTYDYTNTIIEAKSSVPDAYLSQLKDALGKSYSLGDTKTLADKEKTDVIIIVGKTKPQ